MYTRFIHKYLIVEAVIYLILITLIANLGIKDVIFVGGVPYVVLQFILNHMLLHDFRSKCNPVIEEQYPELWERYMTKNRIFPEKDRLFPSPAALFLIFDSGLEPTYRKDVQIQEMIFDAKLYYIFALFVMLPFLLLFAAAILFILYAVINTFAH